MKNTYLAGSMALIAAGSGMVGCAHRDVPPPTPSENTSTPTYRSTVNSYEIDTAPKYTQSGINGGEPATLPAVASPDRFSQNTPLANAAFNSIPSNLSRYIVVASKGGTIKLSGTIDRSDLASVLSDARKPSGVKTVDISQLEIK